MDWINFFDNYIKSKFPHNTIFLWSEHLNGDFGDLKRLEFETSDKIGTIDFWSTGWVNTDIVNMKKSEQELNILCSPEEVDKIRNMFKLLIEIVHNDKN